MAVQNRARLLLLLVATVGIPSHAIAQPHAPRPRHHTYQLIDLGTLGGANGGVPVEGTGGPYINSSGAVIGQANTTIPIPPESLGFVCFPGPTANHAFKWHSSNGFVESLFLHSSNCLSSSCRHNRHHHFSGDAARPFAVVRGPTFPSGRHDEANARQVT